MSILRRPISILAIAAAGLLLLPSAAPTADPPTITDTRTRGGATFPSHVELHGEWLPLRGADLLRWWAWDVYSAAFYVAADKATPEQMLAGDVPRRLVLHYHRNVKASDIVKATDQGLAKNSSVKPADLRADLDRLYKCYSNVGDGDVYTITYHDGTTTIELNGEERCTFEGEEFARAFFGIWVSATPLDKDLAKALRGGK